MRQLLVKPNSKTLPIPVERVEAICAYCGEIKECFRGTAAELSVVYKEPKTKFKYVSDDVDENGEPEYPNHGEYIPGGINLRDIKVPLFGKAYYRVTPKNIKWGYIFRKFSFEKVITGWEERKQTDSADICDDCVRELAEVIPKKAAIKAGK